MVRLYAIEGIEGCGKSTIISLLKEKLPKNKFIFTHEPGGTPAGEDIRNLLLNKNYSSKLTDKTQALLFAAARSELNDKLILPAFADGKSVITDRYFLSNYVYQGLMNSHEIKTVGPGWIEIINKNIILPQITFLLDVFPKTAAERMKKRNTNNYMDNVTIEEQETRRKNFLKAAEYFDKKYHKNRQDPYIDIVNNDPRPSELTANYIAEQIEKNDYLS